MVVVLFLFLGDVRSSVIVVATLVLTPLLTFVVMNRYGLSANLMSLGGLAIAIGLMVDGSVVVIEHAFAKLGEHPGRVARAGDPRGGARGRHAGDLRRRHHHPRVPAADDPAGHGRQDVRAARLHDRDSARDLAGDLADAVARARLLHAQGRRRARHLADPDDQAPLPAPARLGAREREEDRRRRGRALRRDARRRPRSSAPRSSPR